MSLGIEVSDWRETTVFGAVVCESGTVANVELYVQLLPDSINQGEVDYDDLLALRQQRSCRNPDGEYWLFRIGDAVTSRNVHAAMLDAARLCRAI